MNIIVVRENELQANLVVDAIGVYFNDKSVEIERLTYSNSWKISKRTFNEYAFEQMIRNSDLFSFAAMLIKDLAEIKTYRILYRKSLAIQDAYLKKERNELELTVCEEQMNFIEIAFKFLKPIVAKKLEKYLIEIDFVQKCTWIDKFKNEFAPLIVLFEKPI